MKTTPDNQQLLELINYARKGKIVLPQFQRNFVWRRDDINDLLISILEGHFIGSFLLLRTDGDDAPFAMRSVEGVTLSPDQLRPDWMILDGQQRLTSLHYVFAAPDIPLHSTKYPYRFFLDLRSVTESDFDKAIFSKRHDRTGDRLQRKIQFETLVIPFTEIENWNDWLNDYEQWLVERDKDTYFNQYFKIDKPAWGEVIDRIRSFLVPTIEIKKIPPDDPDRISEVCAIFEKMNSTGVRLSVYDLLTARLYRDGIDMHQLWKKTVQEFDLLNEYSNSISDEYGVYVLRTIALIRNLDVKGKTLINLKASDFEQDWWKAVSSMEKALQRMTSANDDGFGVFDKKWSPYSTMISPLSAMLYAIDEQKFGHQAYKLMRRWYWASVFRERYAGSVESTIHRDYRDFIKAIAEPDFEPNALSDARLNIVENKSFSLKTVSRRNSIYRGVMCLIAIMGAKDFQAGDSIEFHTLDDHHIFPRAYLQKKVQPKPSQVWIDSIVNRTLISSQTNKRISRNSPSNYLKKIVPTERLKEIMTSHFINDEALVAMKSDDFNTFMDAREFELMIEIERRLND